MAISKKLAKELNSKPGFKAYLTRDRDVFLTLRQRLNKARQHKADCFLAIHADAFWKRSAYGLSIYALSQRGATSEAARWLANRENQSELIGGADINVGSEFVSKMLINFQQSATVESSMMLGNSLLSKLKRRFSLHHEYVSQAAFVVLKSPDITSLLIETGFISNKNEAKRLNNAKYQRKLVKLLASGVEDYYKLHPVKGGLSARKAKFYYIKVKPKQTLYSISKDHDIKLSLIYKYNPGVKNKSLQVGQKIKLIA